MKLLIYGPIAIYGAVAVGYFLYFIWVFPPPIGKRDAMGWLLISVLGVGFSVLWLPVLVAEVWHWATKGRKKYQ